ncbi:Flp pilus assembly protein CpaB [Virgibacillus byunsanensis]|uniref:Flp pilus assembly protein CpaB n=1 Tax=Virgibacillus byunsanensis TaxID=570945 RepID=A0ABW3LLR5_9BACI
MNTKKIWLTAILFGVIAAVMMYVLVTGSPQESTKPESNTISEEEKEEQQDQEEEGNKAVAAEEQTEEEIGNEIIPASEGARAITITVTDVQGVAGFIKPGSFVDVVTIMQVPEEQAEEQHDSATLLLQNVKVLAIGHAADDAETMKRYHLVTIEVTPQEGLSLGFASKNELYLMLREEGDDQLEPDHTHMHEDDLHEGVFR